MKYLIFLNRFEQDKNVLEKKLNSLSIKIIKEEYKALIVEAENPEQLFSLQEISKAFKIVTDWKELNFKRLNEDSLKAIKETNLKNYKIRTKFHDKIKISAKSVYKHINPYLKHEGFLPDEDNFELILFVEFRKEKNNVLYRVSYSLKEWNHEVEGGNINYSDFAVIIENPSLSEEVSDFLRLCWIFRMKLFIVTQNKDFGKILSKAKEITKGIDYEKFEVVVSSDIPKGYIFAGFSKVAKDSEIKLKEFFSESNNKKIALVFGDDKFGLTQGMRDKMDYMFRLTPELKKPLKSSQALSYVLGLYSCIKIA